MLFFSALPYRLTPTIGHLQAFTINMRMPFFTKEHSCANSITMCKLDFHNKDWVAKRGACVSVNPWAADYEYAPVQQIMNVHLCATAYEYAPVCNRI